MGQRSERGKLWERRWVEVCGLEIIRRVQKRKILRGLTEKSVNLRNKDERKS